MLNSVVPLFLEIFDILNVYIEKSNVKFQSGTFSSVNRGVDFHFHTKLSISCCIALEYAKIQEAKSAFDDANKVLDQLVLRPLQSDERKQVDSIKSRIQASKGAG